MSTSLPTLPGRLEKWPQVVRVVQSAFISGLLGGNLATLALLRRPSALWAHLQYGLFGWRMLSGQGLPLGQLHQLFPTPSQLGVDLLPGEGYLTGWDATYTKDVLYLAMLSKVLSPRTIFEIGTLHGYTALVFALNSPPDTTVYTLDLPLGAVRSSALPTTVADDDYIVAHCHTAEYRYSTHPAGCKVRQLYGDSAVFDFKPYHAAVDLFFVDGAHSYEYVRADSLAALACVRPGGVIVWHDYGRWGVHGISRWLHQLRRSGKDICRLPGSSLALLKM
jgi:hypothetical protein